MAFHVINRCFLKAGVNACAAFKQFLENDSLGFRFLGDFIVLETHLEQLQADYKLFRKYVPEPEELKGPHVVIINADTLRWHHADPSLKRYLGYSLQDLENDWVIAFHPDSCEETDEQLTGVLRDFHNGDCQYAELNMRYQTRPGYSVWAQTTLSLVRDWKGNPEYFMMVMRDVSMTSWTRQFYQVLVRLKGLMESSGFYSDSLRSIDGLLRHYDGENVDRYEMARVHAMVSDMTN